MFARFFILFIVTVVTLADVGLKFDETMKGYFQHGDMDYRRAYEEGQLLNQFINFTVNCGIPSIDNFIRDPNHQTEVIGSIRVNSAPIRTTPKSNMQLFVKGINRIVHMKYYLEYTLDGQEYHLDGIKNMDGTNCLDLPASSRTLYIKVRKGHVRGQGDIVMSGIVIIDNRDTVSLVQSIKPYKPTGWTGWLDFITGMGKFMSFVVGTMGRECFQFSANQVNFWYVWATDPSGNGFLLDLIRRPKSSHLRLGLWDSRNQLLKSNHTVDDIRVLPNGDVELANTKLTKTGVNGGIGPVRYDATWAPSTSHISFVPRWISLLLPILPNIESNYTTLDKPTNINGATYPAGTSLVYTRYTIPIFIEAWEWSLISAMKFDRGDLKVEMMGLYFAGNWLVSSFVHYKGKSYEFTNPVLQNNKFDKVGNIEGEKRLFHGSIQGQGIHLDIKCEGLEKEFITLERETLTDIVTSLRGKCTAVDHYRVETYHSVGNVLLERKFLL